MPAAPLTEAPHQPSSIDDTLRRWQHAATRSLLLLAGVWTLLLVALGTWSTYRADWRNDQYQLINLGQVVYDGGRMYVDCWENKPPGIAWLSALGIALSGGGRLGAWLLPGVVTLFGLAMMGYATARLLSHTTACIVVALAAVVTTMRLYDAPSINPDCYSAMFDLGACSAWLLALGSARRRPMVWFALVAGLLWAASAAVKQTGILGMLAVSITAVGLVACRRRSHRCWLAVCGATWIGFALGTAAVAAVLVARGTLEPAWEAVFAFNRGLWHVDGLAALWHRGRSVRAGLEPVRLAGWLALLGVIGTLRSRKVGRLPPAVVGALLLWWIAQAVPALLGPSGSMRYWQATFPPTLLLAGMGIYHVEQTFRSLDRQYRPVLMVLCVTLMLLLGRGMFDHYAHGVAESYLASSQEVTQRDIHAAVGSRVQSLVPAGRRIYVWAYDVGVYLYSNRTPASRFTYPRSTEQMREILADLAAGKAFAILIGDRASREFNRWCDESCRQALESVLTGYVPAGEKAGDYVVWVLGL